MYARRSLWQRNSIPGELGILNKLLSTLRVPYYYVSCNHTVPYHRRHEPYETSIGMSCPLSGTTMFVIWLTELLNYIATRSMWTEKAQLSRVCALCHPVQMAIMRL